MLCFEYKTLKIAFCLVNLFQNLYPNKISPEIEGLLNKRSRNTYEQYCGSHYVIYRDLKIDRNIYIKKGLPEGPFITNFALLFLKVTIILLL